MIRFLLDLVRNRGSMQLEQQHRELAQARLRADKRAARLEQALKRRDRAAARLDEQISSCFSGR